jgi:DNA-binding response OmpR family regulator
MIGPAAGGEKTVGHNLAIVEDDPDVRTVLERYLSSDGYRVTALGDAAGLESALSAATFDLVIVDVGLPDANGLTLTSELRRKHDLGIIIVSGRGDLTDRIVGLEIGADDYITKPFELREVLARVRSVLRRSGRPGAFRQDDGPRTTYRFNGWTVDAIAQALLDREGRQVSITSGEFKLLEAFVTRPNRVLSRDQLLDLVHTNDAPAFDRSIDVRVGRLRKKLGDNAGEPQLIKTVRNGGYIFAGKVTRH